MILNHFYLCQADEVNEKNFDFSFVIVFRKLGPPQIIHPTHETFQVRNFERQILLFIISFMNLVIFISHFL